MQKIKLIVSVIFFAMISTALLTGCIHKPENKKGGDLSSAALDETFSDQLFPLALTDVNIAGEIGRRLEVTIRNNLLALDPNRVFMDPFRMKDRTSGYIGLGKLIDATVRFAAYTGDADVLKLKNYLIEETVLTQETDGYIGMFTPEERMWSLWDIHEIGYIIWGLIADYQFFNNELSLKAAVKAADYVIDRWSTMPESWGDQQVATHVAVTGLERTMLALYKSTGEIRFKDFCINQRALPEWNLGIVVGRRKGIEGHIYAYMARCLAQLELNRMAPNEKLLQQSHRALDFLTVNDGMTVTGGAGQWEIWTDDQDGGHALGETCATAYQLRVYEDLFRQSMDPYFGDLIERTVYNALFGAQSPDGRQIRYYTPLEGEREYFQGDSYCCPNNYRRIIAELPTMIYYRTLEGGVTINLFASSEGNIDLGMKGVVNIIQETEYPNSGEVTIRLKPSLPVEFPLFIRIPLWAKGSAVFINDTSWDGPVREGNMIKIDRKWHKDDKIKVEMPMEWRYVKGRLRQAGSVAIMRGPMLFCLNPEKNPDVDFEELSSQELGRLIIDPASIEGPFNDSTVRSGGMACRIGAWREGHGMGGKHNMSLLLTEFSDPGGKATYFKIRDMSMSEDDELIRKN